MVDFVIKIAGRVIAVHAQFASSQDYCKAYITALPPDFSVSITRDDLVQERERAVRTDLSEGSPVRNLTDAQLELTAIQRKIAQELFRYDTVLFHGSVVAVDGFAYLFTAKSGTGKSTHTRLWRQLLGQRAVMVNDDKPFLSVTADGVLACGSPWSGKHRLGSNAEVPLKAICILERGDKNCIDRISPQEALYMLLQQSYRPTGVQMMENFLEMIDTITKRVALYKLRCNMEPEAAAIAYEEMSQ